MYPWMNGLDVPQKKIFLLAVSLLIFFSTPQFFAIEAQQKGAEDDSITIDFETFPGTDGELGTPDDIPTPSCDLPCFALGFEYSSVGVTFDSGWLYQGNFFPDAPTTNHFVSLFPFEITLSPPIYAVSIDSYSVWSATLWALDDQRNVITSSVLPHPDEGKSFVLGTVTVESATPIHRLVLRASSCDLIEFCEPILNVDNLTLHFSPPTHFTDGFESGDTSAWTTVVP